jgi:prepilin-type N-terminal cleavage/methylation domain-containing protein
MIGSADYQSTYFRVPFCGIVNWDGMRRDNGFTLIELLTTMFIATLMFVGGGAALRQYWLVRSLNGGADEVVTQLRRQQERAVAESNPLVFGAGFKIGSSDWDLLRYNPNPEVILDDDGNPIPPEKCRRVERRTFDAGVFVVDVDFDPQGLKFSGQESIDECLLLTAGYDEVVMFYARGNATGGTITIDQPALESPKTITVGSITGRVQRL